MFSMVCRPQVHLRHNGHRIFYGRFSLKEDENFARDFHDYLKRRAQNKTLTGGYRHCCSLEIFQKFELPPHEPLAPIFKRLPKYNKDPVVEKEYTDFSDVARKRISEMLLYLDEKPVEIGSNPGKEDCATWSSSFTSKSGAIDFLHDHYDDWVILAENVSILGTEGIMACFLTHFSKGTSRKDFPGDQTSELQGGSFNNPSLCHSEHDTAVGDHSAWSQINQSVANVFDSSFANLEACPVNPLDLPPISSEDMPDMMSCSEAETYLSEHFLDDHWLILAEIVKVFGMDTVSLLFEDSSFEQEHHAGSHKEASVTFQEGKFGYVSSEHRQNYATCGDLAGLTSSISRGCVEQACHFDRSFEFIPESSLGVASLAPCGTSPLSWPPITSEFEIYLNRDSGSRLGEKRRLVTDEPVEFEK